MGLNFLHLILPHPSINAIKHTYYCRQRRFIRDLCNDHGYSLHLLSCLERQCFSPDLELFPPIGRVPPLPTHVKSYHYHPYHAIPWRSISAVKMATRPRRGSRVSQILHNAQESSYGEARSMPETQDSGKSHHNAPRSRMESTSSSLSQQKTPARSYFHRSTHGSQGQYSGTS